MKAAEAGTQAQSSREHLWADVESEVSKRLLRSGYASSPCLMGFDKCLQPHSTALPFQFVTRPCVSLRISNGAADKAL